MGTDYGDMVCAFVPLCAFADTLSISLANRRLLCYNDKNYPYMLFA